MRLVNCSGRWWTVRTRANWSASPPGMTIWRSSLCPTTPTCSARTGRAAGLPGGWRTYAASTVLWWLWGSGWVSRCAPPEMSTSWIPRTRSIATFCWRPKSLRMRTTTTPSTSAPPMRCYRSLPTWGRKWPTGWSSTIPGWWPTGATMFGRCPTVYSPQSWRILRGNCGIWYGGKQNAFTGRTRPRSWWTASTLS